MVKLDAVLTMLAVTLALATTGCDDEGDCSDDMTCRAPLPTSGPPDNRTPPPRPDECTVACANLLGECDAHAAITSDVGPCERQCPVDFTGDEIDCLAALTCGEAADSCLS
jgi:hypothetical protein